MPNPLYADLNKGRLANNNSLFNRIKQFQNTFSGDPKQMIQSMLDSGRITQAQLNQYTQQANEIYRMLK